jgi:2OG-Fe(II) oxygenase superfamily
MAKHGEVQLFLILLSLSVASSYLHSLLAASCRPQSHDGMMMDKHPTSFLSPRGPKPSVNSVSMALVNPPVDDQRTVFSDAVNVFRSGAVPLVCIPKAVDWNDIESWKRDAILLKRAGFGAIAGVVTKAASSSIRANVHQIWLQTPAPASSTPTTISTFVGDLDGRKSLFRLVESLRLQLTCATGDESDSPPLYLLAPGLVELSYLIYDANGAYYCKHIDAPKRQQEHRRAVSFLVYLGSDDNKCEEWNCQTDGGALRIHGADYARLIPADCIPLDYDVGTNDAEVYADITPSPGTMVLFDSTTIPHEVMLTQRGRVCIVGWFGTTNTP